MPTCPSCFEKYPDPTSHCPKDGAALVPDETYAHVDRDLPPGTVVGEYQIGSKLGEGGFGAVYKAVHPLIGKSAAVKILSREFSANPAMVSRFVAEARAVNQIRHRNIIDIFSFGQLPDGRQYYIMELLEGMSFDAYLAERGRLSLADALPILQGIAKALDAAHAKGILHRDLKPENVYLVFDEGRVHPKLLDFGLVKLLGDTSGHKTKTGTPMGTPYYMSPEQCRGLEVDGRTDVYSFGALVFQVLTGQVPFNGESTMDILVQHMTAAAPSASQLCPELPPGVDVAIARMMAKDATGRPARVGEAVDLLAQAANVTIAPAGAPISAPALTMDAEHAVAQTLIADSAMLPTPSGRATVNVLGSSGAKGSTFLGAETDVAPPSKPRSRAVVIAALVALVAGVGVVAVVGGLRRSVPPAPSAQASVAPPSTGATTQPTAAATPLPPPSAPAPTEADVTVAGAPDGTTVSLEGAVLGVVPGPFKLPIGAKSKLVLAANGYKTKELVVVPTGNTLVDVSLEKAPAAGARPASTAQRPPGKAAPASTIHSDLDSFDNTAQRPPGNK